MTATISSLFKASSCPAVGSKGNKALAKVIVPGCPCAFPAAALGLLLTLTGLPVASSMVPGANPKAALCFSSCSLVNNLINLDINQGNPIEDKRNKIKGLLEGRLDPVGPFGGERP